MILRDQFGEIEYHLFDEFVYKGCVLSIVCPDKEATELFGKPVLCVRLREGVLEHEGQHFQIEEGKKPPLFIFEEALVGICLRKNSKSLAAPVSHPPEFYALIPDPLDKPAAKGSRAKTGKKRLDDSQPTLW